MYALKACIIYYLANILREYGHKTLNYYLLRVIPVIIHSIVGMVQIDYQAISLC